MTTHPIQDTGVHEQLSYFLHFIQWCPKKSSVGRGRLLTNWPTTVTTAEVLENTLAKSLVVRLTFHELSCNFDNTGGVKSPPPPHIPSAQSGFHPFVPSWNQVLKAKRTLLHCPRIICRPLDSWSGIGGSWDVEIKLMNWSCTFSIKEHRKFSKNNIIFPKVLVTTQMWVRTALMPRPKRV